MNMEREKNFSWADTLQLRLGAARKTYETAKEKQRIALDVLNAEKAAYDNVLWEMDVHRAVEASGLRRTGCAVVDITREFHDKRSGMPIVAVGYDWGRLAWDGKEYTCRVDVLIMNATQFELHFQGPTLEGVLLQASTLLNRGIQDLTTTLNDVTDATEKLT